MTTINPEEVSEKEADELVDEIVKEKNRNKAKYGDGLEGSSLDE